VVSRKWFLQDAKKVHLNARRRRSFVRTFAVAAGASPVFRPCQ